MVTSYGNLYNLYSPIGGVKIPYRPEENNTENSNKEEVKVPYRREENDNNIFASEPEDGDKNNTKKPKIHHSGRVGYNNIEGLGIYLNPFALAHKMQFGDGYKLEMSVAPELHISGLAPGSIRINDGHTTLGAGVRGDVEISKVTGAKTGTYLNFGAGAYYDRSIPFDVSYKNHRPNQNSEVGNYLGYDFNIEPGMRFNLVNGNDIGIYGKYRFMGETGKNILGDKDGFEYVETPVNKYAGTGALGVRYTKEMPRGGKFSVWGEGGVTGTNYAGSNHPYFGGGIAYGF